MIVGHDWGAMVAWHAPLLHPDRVAAVVGMSVPPVPRAAAAADAGVSRQAFGENFFYILYFQEPGVADAELSGDPARTMRRMMGGLRVRRPGRGAANGRPGPEGFIDRLPEPDGAARLDQPGRVRPLRQRVHPHRIHRRAELVPQLRPQLGADRHTRRRHDHRAVAVHRRHRGSGADVHPRRPRAGGGLRAVPRGDDRRRGALAAAGAARRGQRGAARISSPEWRW